MIRKWPAEHGRELHPKPKFLVTVKAYLSTTLGPNFFIRLLLFMPALGVRSSRNQSIVSKSQYSILKKVSLSLHIWPCSYLTFFLMGIITF